MTYQLRFTEDDPNEFRIDERSRAIGRVGIAAARAALAEAVQRAAEREERVAGREERVAA